MENIKNKKWYDNVLWICIISYAILIISEIIGRLLTSILVKGLFTSGLFKGNVYFYTFILYILSIYILSLIHIFSINFIIIFLYFYIVLTEGIKIPKIVDSETVEISLLQYIWDNIHKYIFNTSIIIPSFFWKGIIRFGILYILLVIITSCIYIFYLFKIALYLSLIHI